MTDRLPSASANTKDEDPTGLLNEGFRYRDLDTGTFITRDPAGFVDGPNQYTYVVQNPWTKFDSEGLFWSALVNLAVAAYDTYEYATGNISGAEYSGRMAITGACLIADVATGGMGAGVAMRAAAVAARAGTVGKTVNAAIQTAKVVDRADTAVGVAQASVDAVKAAASGNVGGAALNAGVAFLGAKGVGNDNSLKVVDDVGSINKGAKLNTQKSKASDSVKTSYAARRKAMRDAGIPTSQQPVSQTSVKAKDGTSVGRQYSYNVPDDGGGTKKVSVQHSLTDKGHLPHWEAGSVKGQGQKDSLGRPRLRSDKSKVIDPESNIPPPPKKTKK